MDNKIVGDQCQHFENGKCHKCIDPLDPRNSRMKTSMFDNMSKPIVVKRPAPELVGLAKGRPAEKIMVAH